MTVSMCSSKPRTDQHTSPVVVQIGELVAPLCNDSERIFQECDDDQKATNGWKISERGQLAVAASVSSQTRLTA